MTYAIEKAVATAALSLLCMSAASAQAVGPQTTATAPSAIDPHALYEQRCSKCHTEHGADLARQKLQSVDGAVRVKRTGKAIEALLSKHQGVTLTTDETSALAGLFDLGIRSKGVFQRHCAICHKSGVAFTRKSVEMKDGRLIAKKAATEIGAFLGQHSRATPAEIEVLIEMMKYQLRTKPKP